MDKRRGRQNSAAYLANRAIGLNIILAELAESAGAASRSWNQALSICDTDPLEAMRHLIDAQVRLHNFAKPEIRDSLRVINRAINLLDLETAEPDEVMPSA